MLCALIQSVPQWGTTVERTFFVDVFIHTHHFEADFVLTLESSGLVEYRVGVFRSLV